MTGNVKYKALERYSVGWTDPKAKFGSAEERLFRYEPEMLDQINAISDADLRNLWMLRFPESPTYDEILVEPFFYAAAYKWWNENKLFKGRNSPHRRREPNNHSNAIHFKDVFILE